MNRLTKFSLTVLMLFMLVIAITASVPRPARAAGPWYVAPAGSNGNTCLSAVSPCATINGALGKAAPGDTVLVATGTYTGTGTEVVSLNINTTLSGGWNSTFITQTGMSSIDGQGARGGLTVSSVVVTVERFTIQNGNGSGIYNGGTLTLNSSTVSGNIGGISNNGTATLNNSVVNGNTTGDSGGGINNSGTLTLNNSTVSDNISLYGGGGGIRNGGTLTLNNSTISDNYSTGDGGGIYNNYGTVTLQNSILAGNTSRDAGPDCNGYPIGSSGYNFIGNTSGCTFTPGAGDQTNVVAKLGPLHDNGGSTLTQALLPGSPAINAGNPESCTNNSGAPLPFDQRGYPRVGRCDIGAYEYGSSSSLFFTKGVVGTFQPSGLVTYTLTLNNVPNLDLTNMSLSDPLPTQVTYVPNSLAVTDGTGAVNNGIVVWTGTVFSHTPTVITFGAMITTTAQNKLIANIATSNWGGYTFSAVATFDTFSNHIYLPLIAHNNCTGPFYADDFNDPASGWPIADNGQVRWEYLNSEYRILVRPPDSWAGASLDVKCSDYTVAVDVRNRFGAGTVGLIFGLSDDWQQFYTFEIDYDGYYYLSRYSGGTWTPLLSGYSSSITPWGGTSRIMIERVGAQIKAYANKQLLISTSDGTYTGLRRMGVFATSYTQPNTMDARFDNFVMCAPGCSGAIGSSGVGAASSGTVNPPSRVAAVLAEH